MPVVANMVAQTSTSTGTGDRTLDGSALLNCRAFVDAFADGDVVHATILDRTTGDTEVGVYTFRTGANRLEVVEVRLALGPNASGATSPVDFAAGTRDVVCDVQAEDVGAFGAMFGAGLDGDATVTTTVQLTRDTYYRNLTISGSGKIDVNGRRLYVAGTLDLTAAATGAIYSSLGANGGDGSGAGSAGFAPTITADAYRTAGGSLAAQSGGNGGSTSGGTPGQAPAAIYEGGGINFDYDVGDGGAGSSGAGGNAGVPNQTGTRAQLDRPLSLFSMTQRLVSTAAFSPINGGRGGCGGGGGGGNGVSLGGGGGAGGAGGPVIVVYARRIKVGGSTGASVVDARGRNGGNGGAKTGTAGCGGGGGGQGGGGGVIYLVHGGVVGSAADALNASGGNGGNGGDGGGSGGLGGRGNTGGQGGLVVVFDVGKGTSTATGYAAWGTLPAPNLPTTETGSLGGAGGSVLVDLP